MFALALVFAATMQTVTAAPAVTVRDDHGAYSVTARFRVVQSPETVLAVLTDYEGIPRFMPDVTTSAVRQRSQGRAVVEQQAVSRVALFSRRIHLVLDIAEETDALKFRDLCGRSFVTYEGSWRITAVDGGSEIAYELTARPAFDVPGFVLSRVFRRNAIRMIDDLKTEIAARAHPPSFGR